MNVKLTLRFLPWKPEGRGGSRILIVFFISFIINEEHEEKLDDLRDPAPQGVDKDTENSLLDVEV